MALPEIVRLREGTPSVIACGAATFPKGTAFGGGGKVSGSAVRRPLGGAGFAQQRLRGYFSHSAALSQKAALQLPFAVTTPPVKVRLERSAERDKREIINILSADDVQSAAEHIPNRPALLYLSYLY